MKQYKPFIYLFLLICFLALFFGFFVEVSKAKMSGDCICSEYRSPAGECFGATTRLCQGPPECADACGAN